MKPTARTSESAPGAAAPALTGEFDRRVYRREFEAVLGCGATWFRTLMKQGAIPPARRDPGGTRLFWTASEVRATLSKLNERAERVAA